MKFSELTDKSRCDDGHVFEARTAVLKPWPMNIHITTLMSPYRWVTAEGLIMSGCEPCSTDQIVCCPVCGRAHPFGLDPAIDEKPAKKPAGITQQEHEALLSGLLDEYDDCIGLVRRLQSELVDRLYDLRIDSPTNDSEICYEDTDDWITALVQHVRAFKYSAKA